MSVFERIAEKAFRGLGATEVRQYAAAKNGRLVADVRADNQSSNQEVRGSIRRLRALGRMLARDNDYFIGFLKKLDANVIGTHGLKLQADAKNAQGEHNEPLNRKVEDAWKDWCRKRNCDVTGQQSMRDIASLFLRTVATDGEGLIRLVVDPTSPYMLKLQMLDVDWLDEDYNSTADQSPTGNRIVMSVEVDQYDKPVAYWFTDPRWSTVSVPGMKLVPLQSRRLRVPADQIIHRFLKERAGQLRGITWAHSAVLTMNQLDGFDEAELIGARVGASNMAFVSPPAPLDGGSGEAAGIDTEVAPGQVLELPAGYTVHEFDPKRPQDTDFSRRLLRKVATALGVSYPTLTSDLSEVNFSSIRAGTIEEREIWRMLHVWLGEQLYQDIYEKFMMFNSSLVPATMLEKVMYPCWRGRGFEWVDPLKDVNADVTAINRGLKTLTESLAERGQDFEETMERHKYEKKFIEKLGLQFASPDLQAQLAADQADAQSQQNEPKKLPAKGKTAGK
jgi:lambda family phage portal protein